MKSRHGIKQLPTEATKPNRHPLPTTKSPLQLLFVTIRVTLMHSASPTMVEAYLPPLLFNSIAQECIKKDPIQEQRLGKIQVAEAG